VRAKEPPVRRGNSGGEAFCYLGLIRARPSLSRLLAMLPPERREQAASLIGSCAELSDLELRNKLAELRFAEAEDLRRRVNVPPGASLERLNPVLRRWLEGKAEKGDGREDH
jgi:hypothetical protein